MNKTRITQWLLILIIILAIMSVFGNVMTRFNHNEHMYIMASVFVADKQSLYTDFGYVQTPYLPLLYGAVFNLFNVTSYYLLIGKFISFIAISFSAGILFLITRRISKVTTHALIVVALFLLNTTIMNSAAEVSNYIIPIALSLLSVYLFILALEHGKTKPLGIAFSGFLLALAIGIKLTYATIIIPFFLVSIFYSLVSKKSQLTVKKSILHISLPLGVGFILGLLPILFFLTDFEVFAFNNLGYHTTNTQWREATGYTTNMTLTAKLNFARIMFFQADNLLLILAILLGPVLTFRKVSTLKEKLMTLSPGAFLTILLVLVSIPTTLAPTPSFSLYYAMPISFLFLLLIYSFLTVSKENAVLYSRLLIALVIISAAYSLPILLRQSAFLINRHGWRGVQVHDIAMEIEDVLVENNKNPEQKIATLSPLFVVDAKYPIYPELTTGPFTYRVGDLLTEKQRNQFITTSPDTINLLFDNDPPAAILVGFEKELDEPLRSYAKANNYIQVDIVNFDKEVYVQP